MSSRARMLSILDLFDREMPVWTAERICNRLDFSASTGYRYIRELTGAGLLTRLPGGAYLLGGRILQLELLMREIDPISRVGKPVIEELATQTGCDTVLSIIYGDQIVNVMHVHGIEQLSLSYERGRPHPMFRGAMSKAMLAFLPRARALRLYDAHREVVARCGMGSTWKEFWRGLQEIKKRGYSESYEELDPGVSGFAAPVFAGEQILGSVGVGFSPSRLRLLNQERLVAMLCSSARRIGQAVEKVSHPMTNLVLSPGGKKRSRMAAKAMA